MNTHTLLACPSVLLASLSIVPVAGALSYSPPSDLNEALNTMVAIVEFEAPAVSNPLWLHVDNLGWGYFVANGDPSADPGTWLWVYDNWIYSEGPDSPYFFMPEIDGWTYHLVGTSWFVDLATGFWFELTDDFTPVGNGDPIPVDGGDGTGGGAGPLDELLGG